MDKSLLPFFPSLLAWERIPFVFPTVADRRGAFLLSFLPPGTIIRNLEVSFLGETQGRWLPNICFWFILFNPFGHASVKLDNISEHYLTIFFPLSTCRPCFPCLSRFTYRSWDNLFHRRYKLLPVLFVAYILYTLFFSVTALHLCYFTQSFNR